MSFNRIVLLAFCVLLGFGLAVTAHAASRIYNLTGGGLQIQIGGGLPLPIQLTNPAATGPIFPNLLVPVKPGVKIIGTTNRTTGQKISIPASALMKPAVQNTLGQFAQNPSLHAVATNLNWVWPTAPVIFSTAMRTGLTTQSHLTNGGPPVGGKISYSNLAVGRKFGGPANFAINGVLGSGRLTNVPVTLFGVGVPGAGNPPCTHPAFGGANPACVAGMAGLLPSGAGAIGGTWNNIQSTPGGTPSATTRTPTPGPVPGVGVIKAGAVPAGTISSFLWTSQVGGAGTMTGFTNMATSHGFPWTTGMITVQNAALGAPEIFVLTGMDNRTASGGGTIQLVSGSLSTRSTTGDNANRGWIKLILKGSPTPTPGVPALSRASLAAMAGLMLLGAGYAMRRRLFA
jgi:hypothetical protein